MAKQKILQAKEKFLQMKSDHERHIQEKSVDNNNFENRLKQKDSTLNQRRDELQRKVKEFENTKRETDIIRDNLNAQIVRVEAKSEELEKVHRQHLTKLEQISGLSAEDAKQQLIESLQELEATNTQAFFMEEMEKDIERMEALGLHVGPEGYAGVASLDDEEDSSSS